MLDTHTTQLQVIATEVRAQLEAVSVITESSFYELREVVAKLRTQFPRVCFFGPILHPDEAKVSLELSVGQEELEVRVRASSRMLKDNEIGW